MNNNLKIIISIIWGLGLSMIFRLSCKHGSNCSIVNYKGPTEEEEKKIFNYGDNKCYSLEKVPVANSMV